MAAAATAPVQPAQAPRPERVHFFATCVVDLMAPGAGADAVMLIEQAGIGVEMPAVAACCGQPAFSSGYRDEARQVARAALDTLAQPWPVVVPSGSCAAMIRHEWPPLFEGHAELHRRALEVAARTVEFSAFACDVLWLADAMPAQAPAGVHAQNPAVKVALHTSCAARREMGTHVPSARLLAALPGVEPVEPARVAECCGFGGTFSARHPAVSGAMVGDKLDAMRDCGAEVIVSADCGCLLNMHHAAQKRREAGESLPRCVHLASFIRERLGATDAATSVVD